MTRSLETYEASQPWVVYTYLRANWWTRIFGRTEIAAECCICGTREVLSIKMPRFGPVIDRGRHPLRVAFLAPHVHKFQQKAPETWVRPLRNPEAHDDTLDILRDIVQKSASPPSGAPTK
jgi:hypothetical protein